MLLPKVIAMIEIRFHGRGGQGAVVASKLLAQAAFLEDNDVQSFPYFGVERRGAPVTAFTKIDKRPIRIKSQIYEPDYVIVLDPSLMNAVDVAHGLKKNGLILINSNKKPEKFNLPAKRIATVDATSIAIAHRLGSKHAPIVNSAILGAFSKASKIVKLSSLINSILEISPAKKEENAAAAKEAYEKVTVVENV